MKVLKLSDSIKLLSKYGVKFADYAVVKKEEDLKKIRFGFPWALKASGSRLSHKTEKGAVLLGIDGLENAVKAVKKLKKIRGAEEIVAQKQLTGTEMIVGAKRDAQFGSTVLAGMGGIFTEVLKDFSVRICPVSEKEAGEMLTGLKGGRILQGFRKQKPVNLKALSKAIVSVNRAMMKHPEIQEIDLNPIIADSKNAIAVDARIVID